MTIIPTRIIKNIGWLGILNISNIVVPFLTFPYITRIFSPSGYGLVAFSLAFVSYFQTLIDYGFNLTATRKIALVRSNKEMVDNVFSSIILAKLLLLVISTFVILASAFIFSPLHQYRDIILIFMLLIFGNAIMPTWFFQGFNEIPIMAKISIFVRICFVVCVFIIVKDISDLKLYCFIYSLSFFLIGSFSIIYIIMVLKVRFVRTSFQQIVVELKDGWYVFTSSVIIKIASATSVFILGLFATPQVVGSYSAMEKMVSIITMSFYPIGQGLYPFCSQLYQNSFESGIAAVVKIAKIIVPLYLLLTLSMIVFSKYIVQIVLGSSFIEASNYLYLMAFIPLLSILSNLLGTQILVASGHNKEYSQAFMKTGIVYIILFIILGKQFSAWGVATASVVGGIFNLIFFYFEIKKSAPNLWSRTTGKSR